MIAISVIVGSTREGRFSEKPAKWILQQLRKRESVDAGLAELNERAAVLIDELLSWTTALKTGVPARPDPTAGAKRYQSISRTKYS